MRETIEPSMLSLHEPGVVRVQNAWLDAQQHATLRTLAARARAALEAIGCGTCAVRIVDSARANMAALARVRTGAGECELSLDGELARGLVDGLTGSRVGLVGTGRLSQVERSMLEYILLRLCAGLAPVLGGCSLSLLSFTELDASREAWECALELDVGGRCGRMHVRGVRAIVGRATNNGPVQIAALAAPLRAHVAIASVGLSSSELGRLSPGDCVMLPYGDVGGVTNAGCETVLGWRLFDVGLLAMSDYVLRCEARAWSPRPVTMPVGAELPAVRVLVGTLTVSPMDAETLAAPRRIDVELGAQPNVTLCLADRIVGRGELVQVHGRLGVRVTESRGV